MEGHSAKRSRAFVHQAAEFPGNTVQWEEKQAARKIRSKDTQHRIGSRHLKKLIDKKSWQFAPWVKMTEVRENSSRRLRS